MNLATLTARLSAEEAEEEEDRSDALASAILELHAEEQRKAVKEGKIVDDATDDAEDEDEEFSSALALLSDCRQFFEWLQRPEQRWRFNEVARVELDCLATAVASYLDCDIDV